MPENFTKTKDYSYELPEELIAQTPIENRDKSRLMVLDKYTGEIEHKSFFQLPELLEENDCLILNDSKVLPARIYGVKEESGAVVEFLLLHPTEDTDCWEVLAKPGKRAKIGSRFSFGDGLMSCQVKDVLEDGSRILKFEYHGLFYPILDEIGQMPLPPYIKERLEQQSRYQTVYARELGSAAAPTAGLHFTQELLNTISQKGIGIGYLTLHVGLGTFRPVSEADILQHKMHSEHFSISRETAELINRCKEQGGRVIAVGTTSCRTLEAVMEREGRICQCEGDTDIFIYPGYKFKAIDALVTNFHLPESTLIMLISALAGRNHVLNAYEQAVKEKYRFFSFGDAMLII